ncbi:Tub_2 domain-containing protein [Cephalotus follicularis]|uniref:Tub_2 domain-containing protein n=1 Tax=Cephalotus follicularis TaxID=3775 RepID=A0A1Q3C7E1_CEPFO|nr:Tub_2 domain-containing protein [Cephalotus follicularis]
MKMFFFKSMSRSVHEEHHPSEIMTDGECTSLTVWKKSLLVSCNGFTVIDSNGNLVYRVDNYMRHNPHHEIILMDSSGKSLLTIRRRKKLRLADGWLVFEGEDSAGPKLSKPKFCVRKHIKMLRGHNPNVLAYVYREATDKRHAAFVIEGSYTHRSCKVRDGSRRVVAEIKRKEDSKQGISFGLEVFSLRVQPGFDPGFAMALVLILDQMFS